MDQLVVRLFEFWRGLTPLHRLALVGIPAVVIIGLFAALTMVISAPMAKVTLFKDMEIADASRIVTELKKQNVDYRLDDGGRAILVPADQVYDLRLDLAGMGLPQGDIGFEIFDESKLGITEQGMRVDYQRALQGELQRTLESWEQVADARVLLNIAPQTSFLDTDARSTASVSLTLKPGDHLNDNQVEGAKHLVSRSVSRLDPEDVTVVDSRGNPLSGSVDTESEQQLRGMAIAELRHKLRQHLERNFEHKLRAFLEEPYGAGNVAAAVSLEMDFRQIKSQFEEYTPVVGDQGVEERVEEHRKSETGIEETPGGVPGTTSNIPGYLGVSPGGGSGTESSEYDLIVDYLVNREVREEDLPPGTIMRRTAAVALSTDTWDVNTKTSVEQLVASAIGANITAGDVIDVQAFLFSEDEGVVASAELVSQQRGQNIMRIIGWAIALVLVVVALAFLRGTVIAGLPRDTTMTPFPLGDGDIELPPGMDVETYKLRKLDELGTTQQDMMRHEISRMIDSEPERVASLLRTWMLEDA